MHRPTLASSAELDLKRSVVESLRRAAHGCRAFFPFEAGVHDGTPFDEESASRQRLTDFASGHQHSRRLSADAVELEQIRKKNLSEITC